MDQEFKERLEKKLKGIEDELHDLNASLDSYNNLDDVCEKLDTIITILKHNAGIE